MGILRQDPRDAVIAQLNRLFPAFSDFVCAQTVDALIAAAESAEASGEESPG